MSTNPIRPKNKHVNTHFLLGLTIALSVSLISFEWGKHSNYLYGPKEQAEDPGEELEEFPPVTFIAEATPKPKMRRAKAQVVLEPILMPTQEVRISTDPNNLPELEFDPSAFEAADTAYHEVVLPFKPWALSEQPSFPGGPDEFGRFMSANLNFPARPLDIGIEGTVYLRFVIGKDGSINEHTIRATRSPHPDMTREAIRVLRMMPKWNPGRQGVYPVPVIIDFPISFKLR